MKLLNYCEIRVDLYYFSLSLLLRLNCLKLSRPGKHYFSAWVPVEEAYAEQPPVDAEVRDTNTIKGFLKANLK
ncbi:uncharacterized protein TrAtP1_010814 [Trichoderma atroviride]|uniref:uncharacterized protein n=1 Tax=Hypocrea atroviridis TaxID=63577 RepID=UPI0033252FC4|nr:hypothetical protein TrAtP1_010814 [Trichoderma atroviride]